MTLSDTAASHEGAPYEDHENIVTVLVCDDHPIVHSGVRGDCQTTDDIRVVADAYAPQRAVKEYARHKPDVVLMDLHFPEEAFAPGEPGGASHVEEGRPPRDGFEATRHITKANPEAKVIVYSAHGTDFDVLSAIKAGALGFLAKSAPTHEVLAAIRAVAAGGSVINPHATARLLKQLRGGPDVLTTREVEVLQLVSLGQSNSQISRQLGTSTSTVGNQLNSIFAKLGAADRTSAVTEGLKQRVIRLDDQPTA